MSRVPLATSKTGVGLPGQLRRPTCAMEWFYNGTAMHWTRLDPILEADEAAWESAFTPPFEHTPRPWYTQIAEKSRGSQTVNEWTADEAPPQLYPGEPQHSTCRFDQKEISRACAVLRNNFSQHQRWVASAEFEDHWSRLCDMDWDIFQNLPEDIKRRLGREWEVDELDPVRYIITCRQQWMLTDRPDGDWRAPLHLYLSRPAFVAPSWNAFSGESGVPSTPFFINSGLEDSWCFVTYCFPRRSEPEQHNSADDLTTKEFGPLYEFYLREHIPKCLAVGGSVILVFGNEAKETFQELFWEDPNKVAERPNIIHGTVPLDVEIVTYSNSKLVRKSKNPRHLPDDIRHVVIYVPDPCPFIANIPVGTRDGDPIPTLWAMKTSASIDYAALLIGKELPHSFVWRGPAPVVSGY